MSIKEDVEVLGSFTNQIQESIREIRSAYDDLLNRIEKVIISSFDCSEKDFRDYKDEIISKVSSVDMATLAQKQNVFYKRLISPLDDKESWIKSVADVALGKPLEELLDDEEPLLINNIKELSLGLIKASEIRKFNKSSSKGKLYSLRFFGERGEAVDDVRFIKSDKSKVFINTKSKVNEALEKLTEKDRRDLLIEILSKELDI